MKKNLFVILALVLAMLLSTAFAEGTGVGETKTVSGKITLWTHDVVIMDQADEMMTYPMNVTFEPKSPVELTILPVAEQLQKDIRNARDGVFTAPLTRRAKVQPIITSGYCPKCGLPTDSGEVLCELCRTAQLPSSSNKAFLPVWMIWVLQPRSSMTP